MSIGGWFKGMLSRVFGGGQISRSDPPGNIAESGVDFNYPVIFVPGPPNHNALRNRDVNDAALPFTPEEYKKIRNEIESRHDLNPLMKQEMLKTRCTARMSVCAAREKPHGILSSSSSMNAVDTIVSTMIYTTQCERIG